MKFPTNMDKLITKIVLNMLDKHHIKYMYIYSVVDGHATIRYEVHAIVPIKKLTSYDIFKYKEISYRCKYKHCLLICVRTRSGLLDKKDGYAFVPFYVKREHYKTNDNIFYFKNDEEKERAK